jgi:hypothetical protein
MKKLTIETKYKTYTAYLIESAVLLHTVLVIGTLGIFYPLSWGTEGITLGRFIVGKKGIFYDDKGRETATLRHEKIHIVQQRELTFIWFVVLYFGEYLKHYFKTWSTMTAYDSISFEKEAYKHQDEVYYLLKRNKNDWKKYLYGD